MTAVASNAAGSSRQAAGHDRRRVLENLPTGQRTTSADALARSKMVARLRIALPVLAVLLVLVFLMTSQPEKSNDAFLDDFKNLEATPEELVMSSPRFAGVDDDGKPFNITAETATREPDTQERVALTNPRAVTRDDGEETVVTANRGVYQSDARLLTLNEDVVLNHALGADNYVLRANDALVKLGDQKVEHVTGVEGGGPGGNTLRADAMEAYQGNGRVIFKGNVKLKIYQSSQTTGPVLRDVQTDDTSERPQ